MDHLRIGSLCTGYGGLEMGLRALFPGAVVSFMADNDPAVSVLLESRYPHYNHGDLFEIRGADLPGADILAAGFPCQPFSVIGKQAGKSDKRFVFDEITRIISEMDPRPGMLVLENVPGLRTVDNGWVFHYVIRALANLRYVGSYGVYRAAEIGAPHPRARLFLVAFTADAPGIIQRVQDARGDTSPAESEAREILARGGISDSETSFWSPYGDTIHRWERICRRVAPFPVEPFPGSLPRVSLRFVEWMMGIPEGWVTDLPLKYEDRARILGNGVVPQQAEYAIRDLL